ncbi:hypothetical protein B0675_02395 [Streptomyces sp. M41(2017)]|uniref:hypothetical protein n=1 Tax=Streptomyces sp. M41(2017) TaxID=1955065 RepID=UPI0009C06B5D|nr:hypothetical protein [Streptomyces sp. M41(2017)]OQQ16153.1 hypothetical protein B0675_02395 [Streptomyces sp. M41(2017)]
MSPDVTVPGSARSAAEILNEQIRDLWTRAGGRLTAEQRREYEQLLVLWAAAMRGQLVTAA